MRLLGAIEPLPRLRNPIFIASFASHFDGAAGAAAVEHLVEAWDARPVAELDPDECFDYTVRRPLVHTVEGQRLIEWPTIRMYVAHGDERDFILMPGIEPGMRWRGVTDAILEALETMGCTSAVILSARAGAIPHTRPTPIRITGAPSAALSRRFHQEPARSNYQGPTGFNAVLATALELADFDAVTVSALTPSYLAADPNPLAVRALVHAVDDAFGTSTALARIEDACQQFSRSTDQAVASAPSLAATVAGLEQEYDWFHGSTIPGPARSVDVLDLPSGPELVEELERLLLSGGGPTMNTG